VTGQVIGLPRESIVVSSVVTNLLKVSWTT
jgi:hypothetical protein